MKNVLRIAILATMLAPLAAVSASRSEEAPVPSPEKTIAAYFRFPRVLFPLEAGAEPLRVQVLFTTSAEGNVRFAHARTSNAVLAREIEQRFSGMRISGLKPDVVHSVVLKFTSR